jgi:hypothetical protein
MPTLGINQTQQSVRSINNQKLPQGGPDCVPFVFPFSLQPGGFNIDMSTLTTRGFIKLLQTMYVDNSLNSSPAMFQFGAPINHTITCPPYSQGFYSICLPDPPVMLVTSAGTVTVNALFLNVPIPPSVWYPTSSGGAAFKFDGNGNLETSDQNLVSAIASGYLQSQMFGRGSNDTVYPEFVDANWFAVNLTGVGVSSFNVLQQAANTSFFFSAADISLSGESFLAAAGELLVTLYRAPDIGDLTGAVAIMQKEIYLPGAAPATPQPVIPVFNFQQCQYHNKSNAAAYLHVGISAALSGGKLSANIYGGNTALEA